RLTPSKPPAIKRPIPGKVSAKRRSLRDLPTPPPPPPIVRGRSSGRSSRGAFSTKDMFAKDPTGRMDLVGRPVPFYPSARTLNLKGQQSAQGAAKGTKTPRENPNYKNTK